MMTKNLWRPLVLILFMAILGCESNPTLGPRAPHGGTILPIPDKKGSIELVKKEVEGQAEQVRFVVYFSGPNDKPLATAPTATTFTPTGKGAKPVQFKPTGNSDASMASDPFPNSEEIDGNLSVTIDGEPITIPVKIR